MRPILLRPGPLHMLFLCQQCPSLPCNTLGFLHIPQEPIKTLPPLRSLPSLCHPGTYQAHWKTFPTRGHSQHSLPPPPEGMETGKSTPRPPLPPAASHSARRIVWIRKPLVSKLVVGWLNECIGVSDAAAMLLSAEGLCGGSPHPAGVAQAVPGLGLTSSGA